MKSTKVVSRYAKAFLQYALECKKEEILAQEMKQLYLAVDKHSNLENFFFRSNLKCRKKTKNKRKRI